MLNSTRINLLNPRIVQSHIPQYSECEYDHGFIILSCDTRDDDGEDNVIDIWCCAEDFDPGYIPESYPPSEKQIAASATSQEIHGPVGRGHFLPYASIGLGHDDGICAMRFIYPTLLVLGYDFVFSWDAQTNVRRDLTLEMRPTDPLQSESVGQILDVDFTDRSIVICGSAQVRIFSWDDGTLLSYISSREIGLPSKVFQLTQSNERNANSELRPLVLAKTESERRTRNNFFVEGMFLI